MLLLFLKLQQHDTLQQPIDLPKSKEARVKWLDRVAREVVDFVYNPTVSDDVKRATEAAEKAKDRRDYRVVYPYCFCREGGLMSVTLKLLDLNRI